MSALTHRGDDRSGALFSRCGRYRYRLWRGFDVPAPRAVLWLMLNPSTADETVNDPTVERCWRRTRAMGYDAMLVGNIFALRSTDPQALYADAEPIGPENDRSIGSLAHTADLVVCGWGNHGTLDGRGVDVITSLESARLDPHALRITKAGQPTHPLYVAYAHQPQPIAALMTGKAGKA